MHFQIKFKISFLILFYSPLGFSQNNFIAGYIIKNNGDTLHGFIDYIVSSANPKSLEFREKIDNKSTVFYPKDIKGFSTELVKDIFHTTSVEINTNQFDIERSRIYRNSTDILVDLIRRRDTVFSILLVKGEINLYKFIDTDKQMYFITKNQSGQFETLLDFKYKFSENTKLYIAHTEEYKSQLRNLVKTPSLLNRIDKIRNIEEGVYDIIKSHNKNHSALEYSKPISKLRKRVYIEVGIAQVPRFVGYRYFNNLRRINNLLNIYSVGTEFSESQSKFKKNYRLWQVDLSYFKYSNLQDSFYYDYLKRTLHYTAKLSTINLTPTFGYYIGLNKGRFPAYKTSFFIKGGPIIQYYLKSTESRYETDINGTLYNIEQTYTFPVSKLELSYSFKFGLNINNIIVTGSLLPYQKGVTIGYFLK